MEISLPRVESLYIYSHRDWHWLFSFNFLTRSQISTKVGSGSRNINARTLCESYIAKGKLLRKMQLGLICTGKIYINMLQWQKARLAPVFHPRNSTSCTMDLLGWSHPTQSRKPAIAHAMGMHSHRGPSQPGSAFILSAI